jgi:hypothetical protein
MLNSKLDIGPYMKGVTKSTLKKQHRAQFSETHRDNIEEYQFLTDQSSDAIFRTPATQSAKATAESRTLTIIGMIQRLW